MRKLIASTFFICGLIVTAIVTQAADEQPKTIEAAAVNLGRPVDFDRDILPIIENNCIACHNIAIDEGKLSLEDVEDVMKGGKRGPAVVPKDPEKSNLFLFASRGKKPAMPPLPNKVDAAALTPRELGLIRQWILEGATKGAGGARRVVQWQPLPSSLNSIYSVALSPWGQFAAAGRANQISIYDLASNDVARLIDPNLNAVQHNGAPMYPRGAAHRDFVNSMAFSADGTLLATGGYRVVKLWRRVTEPKKFALPVGSEITAVAISGDGKWAAVTAADKTIRLWNLIDGKPGKTLSGHTDRITGLEFWPRPEEQAAVNTLVVTTAANVQTMSRNLAAAKKAVIDFQSHPDPKLNAEQLKAKKDQLAAAQTATDNALQAAQTAATTAQAAQAAFQKQIVDEGRLFSVSADKTVRIWKPADGSLLGQVASPAAVNDVTVTRDGTKFVTADADKILRVWAYPIVKPKPAADAGTEKSSEAAVKPLLELKGHGQPVTSVDLIYTPGTQIISGSTDATVRLWDINNGKQIRSLNHGGPVVAVAARADGQRVVSVSDNGIGKLWQTSDGKQLAELKSHVDAQRLVTVRTERQTIAKQRFALADNALKAAEKNFKDREAAAKKATEAKDKADKAIADSAKKAKEAEDNLKAAKDELAKNPDDAPLKKKVADAQKAVDGAQAAVKNVKAAQAQAVRSLGLAQKAVETAKAKVAVETKDKQAADAFQKQLAQEVTQSQEAEKTTTKSMRAVAFSPDGKKLVTTGDDNALHLWDATTGKPLDAFAAHQASVVALAFSADGVIISGSNDKTAVAWNARPEWTLIGQLGPNKKQPLELSTSPFINRVLALDFSRDGKLLATGGGDPSRSGELMIWDVEKQQLVRTIEDAHSDTVMGVEFSRDAKMLVSGATDKFVKLFDVATGKHIRSFEGHTHHVLDVSLKGDMSTIISAGADNAIKVWNTETGEQRRTIGGHSKQVISLDYIGATDNFISCSGDRTVRLYTASNGKNNRSFSGGSDFMYAAACARDQSIVIAGGEDGVLRVWNGKDGKSIATFQPPAPAIEGSEIASASAAK